MLWQSSKHAYIIQGTTFPVKKKCLLAQISDLFGYLLNQQLKLSPCPTVTDKVAFVTPAELKGRIESHSLLPLASLGSELPNSTFVSFLIYSFLNYEHFYLNDMNLSSFLSEKKFQKLMLHSDLTGLMMCYITFFSLGSFLSNNQKLLLIRRQFRSWTSIVVSGPRKQVFTNHTQILRKWYLLASFSWEPEWIWKWSGRGNADLCRVHPFINVRQLVSPKMSFQPAT